MNLKYKYWYFTGALSSKFCDDVIKLALSKKINRGGTRTIEKTSNLSRKKLKDLKKYRDSNIVWLDERWIFEALMPYVHAANQNAGWNFEIDQAEKAQFTIYKKGQYYHWHADAFVEPYNTPKDLKTHGKYRKLSVTINLTDPKKYKGGEFMMRDDDIKNPLKPLQIMVKEGIPRGSIVVFPSFLYHRVKPITKGTRYSLVVWFIGKPFK
tara:strand:- start:105 stop:734 length:630 start_codon:yes stop_codon:yes gene_type:complete